MYDNGYFYKEGTMLMHSGKKGMKWGFTDGVKNGGRIASEFIQGIRGQNYHTGSYGSANFNASVRPGSPTSRAYRAGQNVRNFPKDFRSSIDDTVGTWVDDQKDFYNNAGRKARSLKNRLASKLFAKKRQKAAQARMNDPKHKQNASYYKPNVHQKTGAIWPNTLLNYVKGNDPMKQLNPAISEARKHKKTELERRKSYNYGLINYR